MKLKQNQISLLVLRDEGQHHLVIKQQHKSYKKKKVGGEERKIPSGLVAASADMVASGKLILLASFLPLILRAG